MDGVIGTLSLLNSEPLMILVQVLLFYVFHLLMCQIFYKPLAKVRAERAAVTSDKVAKAKAVNERTLKIKSEYEEAVSNARRAAVQKLQEAQRQAESMRQERLESAKKEAAQILQQAKANVAAEREKAKNELDAAVSRLALEMAQRVLSGVMGGEERDRAVKKLAGDNVL
ncbi:ATP synthase F0 subunit B [bacterium]|nr:ATP synthase F0 subunit B [bacterium]